MLKKKRAEKLPGNNMCIQLCYQKGFLPFN
jgi:hypothetical protein